MTRESSPSILRAFNIDRKQPGLKDGALEKQFIEEDKPSLFIAWFHRAYGYQHHGECEVIAYGRCNCADLAWTEWKKTPEGTSWAIRDAHTKALKCIRNAFAELDKNPHSIYQQELLSETLWQHRDTLRKLLPLP